MKRQPRILAGTALGLLMASAPLGAFPLQQSDMSAARSSSANAPVIFVQAACAEGQSPEECAAAQGGETPRKLLRRQKQEEAQPEAPREAAPAQEQEQPRKQRRQQQEEAQPEAPREAAPAQEQEQPRKQRRQQQEEVQPEAPKEAAPAQEQEQPRKQRRQQQEEVQPEAPKEAAPAQEQEQPRKLLRQKKEQVEPAEKPVPAPEAAPKPAEKPAAAEEAAPKPEAKPEQPAPGQTLQEGAPKPENAAPAGEKPAAQPDLLKPAEKPAEGQQPAEQPAPSQQPAQGEQPAQGQQPADGGVQGQAPAQDPNAPPLLDSQKERRGKGERGKGGQAGEQGGQTPAPADQAQQPAAPVEQGPPPTDDKAAQEAIQPEKIVPVTEEKGERRERPRDIRDRERPRGADVVKEIGDRLIIQFNNQTIVESNERPRMTRGARDVYYEDLPRGRTREIIERPNGVKVITIRNANGDIIRRSRIDDSGREYVLNYVDESYYDNVREWRDPGEDLPPLRLSIPRAEYILDSESVEEPADYYEFLEQPPVEKVTRLYSVDEVKRSARVRDIARRIDLDTLNFEFGSASIPDSEVEKLQGVADAMQKLLEKNPAETFLIEGHTDAVGSDNANLALSDERAEAVASALTNSFEIPPENLTTQGYGESYLKVDSSGPERENRRVAIRRITPLVAPVASAQ